MKKYVNDQVPGDVFHPAEFIKDEMEAQNIKQADLARISGFNRSFVSLLLKGERSITIPFAIALEKAFNIPAEVWIKLQKNYEMNKDLILLKKARLAS